jgi:hypothetical protein
MTNELITVKQQAILTEQFDAISGEIDKKIALANGMAVSEDNYKDAKKIRADMNKEAKVYADEFKKVEEKVCAPWNQCKAAYQAKVRDKYREIDSVLKDKIGDIETGLKSEKEEKIISFFTDHKEAAGLCYLEWSDMGITVKMSDSEKSLKDAVMAKLSEIKSGSAALAAMDNAAELLAEYKANDFNLSAAISTVQHRKEAAERQAEEIEKARKARAAEREHIDALKTSLPEIEKIVEVKKVSATFKVSAELEKIRALVEFMRGENIEFEQIK